MPVSKETLDEIALTREEYEKIVEQLGREPNGLELGMFGALWSEHCGYKHSKRLLQLLPSESPHLLALPGAENAGVVNIGNGLAAVFKIESHNHPSAVEPYEGAATGVGGIVRDILAMGARPMAILNSLRFGPTSSSRSRYLFNSVVAGISGYGNCIGVPNVGGEITFSPSYEGNPLVNALCLGVVRHGDLIRSAAQTPGNLLVLVGAETGRDGIHGASGLASRTFGEEREQRPAVQVGNPFLEKVLIEACLEVARAGLIEGMQDLGAAGLTSSCIESAERGGVGIRLDVFLVPRREQGMTPYEVMLSESQERMLLIVPPANLNGVMAIMKKWDTLCTVVGEVTNDGIACILEDNREVASVPIALLTQPPLYDITGDKPQYLTKTEEHDLSTLPLPNQPPNDLLLALLASPNIASRAPVYQQYDHQVQTNTILEPGKGDAALLRIKGTNQALALSTDANGRMCYLNPYVGGAFAVAEACRNLVCTGAKPLALSDCLNFGDPERPEVAYQLSQSIKGMAKACETLGVPIVSGNVSLYNESSGQPIYPTPVIGALGIVDDLNRCCTPAFQNEGDIVSLLGKAEIEDDLSSLSGSEYLEIIHGLVVGQPSICLEMEVRLQRCCLRLIREGLLNSAHDCAEGGLGVALSESAIQGNLGFHGTITLKSRWDASLFGEAASRIVISFCEKTKVQVEQICMEEDVPLTMLGSVGGARFVIPSLIDLPLSSLEDAWRNGLEKSIQ
jgi:phosphoribosylformylglycinamidine synthase II